MMQNHDSALIFQPRASSKEVLETIDPLKTFENERFPNELFYKIFDFLTAKDLLSAWRVCRKWKYLIESPLPWKCYLPFAESKTPDKFPHCVFGLTSTLLDQKRAMPSEKLNLESHFFNPASFFHDFNIESKAIATLVKNPNAFLVKSHEPPHTNLLTRELKDFAYSQYAYSGEWIVTLEGFEGGAYLSSVGSTGANLIRAFKSEEGNVPVFFEVFGDILIYAQSEQEVVLYNLAEQTTTVLPISPVWCYVQAATPRLAALDGSKTNICIYDLDKLHSPKITLKAPEDLYRLKATAQFIVGLRLGGGFIIWNLEAMDSASHFSEIAASDSEIEDFFINGVHLIVCEKNDLVKVYHLSSQKIISHFPLFSPLFSKTAQGSTQREVYQNLLIVKFADNSLHIYDLLLGKLALKNPKIAFPKAFLKIQVFGDNLYGMHEDGLYKYPLG